MIAITTPDVTTAQGTAIAGWILAQAAAFGLNLNSRDQLLISVGSTVLAVALKFADAHIRGHRALVAAVQAYQSIPASAREDVRALIAQELQKIPAVKLQINSPETLPATVQAAPNP